jgi:hypothetical protein
LTLGSRSIIFQKSSTFCRASRNLTQSPLDCIAEYEMRNARSLQSKRAVRSGTRRNKRSGVIRNMDVLRENI